jgi:beta-N-acetylhexosaminidase
LIFAAPLETFSRAMIVKTAAGSSLHPYPPHPSREALAWADKELKRMSLDEKIGQLVSIGINATFLNRESAEFLELKRQVEQNHIGGVTLFRSPVYESAILMNRLQKLARIPLLVSADLEAGTGMRFDDTINFPWNMAVAATGNPDYARRQGAITAREARALGVQHILAPVADVNNNAANPVINVRSYGENPQDVARFVAAFVEGTQSGGAIACAKHFPGHGDTATDSHRGLPVINVARARLDAVELIPFRAAVETGVGSVMVGHIGLPQLDATQVSPLPRERRRRAVYVDEGGEVLTESATLPATLSPVIEKILRRDLHFDGLVVTDALDMSGLTIYFTPEESAVRAVLAGADMLLKPADADATIRGLREAVKQGRITESRIDESARKILAAKYDAGLVENRFVSIDAIDERVSNKDAVALADEIAEHAITLVRDDAKELPLANQAADARLFNLAITNGDDRSIAATFNAEMRRLGRRVEGVLLDERSTPAEVERAIERASRADTVIASLYGRVRSGQANSVGVPDAGARALKTLLERHKPIVGISFGNPYLLENFPALQTYLVAYGDMPCLQRAAARAILGRISITGKLPISLPNLYARGAGIQLNKIAE